MLTARLKTYFELILFYLLSKNVFYVLKKVFCIQKKCFMLSNIKKLFFVLKTKEFSLFDISLISGNGEKGFVCFKSSSVTVKRYKVHQERGNERVCGWVAYFCHF